MALRMAESLAAAEGIITCSCNVSITPCLPSITSITLSSSGKEKRERDKDGDGERD
jgi:hypothetical protein